MNIDLKLDLWEYLAATDKTVALVYCTGERDLDMISRGVYHTGCTVTVTPIEGNWYCVEAVRKS